MLPPTATEIYEALRTDVVEGCPHPEGIAILRFHGMLSGLAILLKATPVTTSTPTPRSSALPALSGDSEFIRLLANLVLHTHSELTHVC